MQNIKDVHVPLSGIIQIPGSAYGIHFGMEFHNNWLNAQSGTQVYL